MSTLMPGSGQSDRVRRILAILCVIFSGKLNGPLVCGNRDVGGGAVMTRIRVASEQVNQVGLCRNIPLFNTFDAQTISFQDLFRCRYWVDPFWMPSSR